MKTAIARQNDNDAWTIEVTHESGIIEFKKLGPLSKEQLFREIIKHGYDKITTMDKRVCKAFREGKVVGTLN